MTLLPFRGVCPMCRHDHDKYWLPANISGAVKDAARYRWLRDVALGMDQIADPDNAVQVWWGTDPAKSAYGKDLDEAVDRGMKESKK